MITDTITNAARYAALHPDFADAVHLLQTLDFAALPDGQVPCANPNIRLFVGSEPMRSKAEAKPEAHLKHIDIQVPISGEETYGWIDRGRLKNGLGYDEKRDIEFFDCEPETWLTLQPGEFALFFPNDAHAPLVATKSPYAKPSLKSVSKQNATDFLQPFATNVKLGCPSRSRRIRPHDFQAAFSMPQWYNQPRSSKPTCKQTQKVV